MKRWKWLATVAVATGCAVFANGADPDAKGAKVPEPSQLTFGTLRAMPVETAKAKVADYLKSVGKLDQGKLDAIWQVSETPLITKVIDSIALGNPDARKAIDDARDVTASAPTEVPAVIKGEKNAFVKTNLGAAYARGLAGKKVYEEALEAVKDIKSEELVDPAAFFFFKAVAEHSLAGYQKAKKIDATNTIVRLVDDVVDAPDRYRVVATQMFFDIQSWSKEDKDLGNIGKLMDNSGRRLDLARGGNTTQDIQKRIIFRLDEKIKELENQCKGGNCNGGACPGGGSGPASGQNPSGPAGQSSLPITGPNAGKVDEKKLKQIAEVWGTLPPSERQKLAQEITRDMPAKYKPMIEEYFKSLNRINGVEK